MLVNIQQTYPINLVLQISSIPNDVNAIIYILNNNTHNLVGQFVVNKITNLNIEIEKNVSYSILVFKPYYLQVIFNNIVQDLKYTFTATDDSEMHSIAITGTAAENNNSITI